MRTKVLPLIITFLVFASRVQAEATYVPWPDINGPYLGQQPPGLTAEMFAPDIVSTDRSEINSVFTPDGNEFYFTTWDQENGTRIMFTRQIDGRWSVPERASFSTDPTDVDPAISYDGQRVFFGSRRSRPEGSPAREGDFDLWFADRDGPDWGEAKYMGPVLNSGTRQVYPSVTLDGSLYFQAIREGGYGKADIYRSRLLDGNYQEPENLGPVINSGNYEGDVFIAPDESYLIVSISGRDDGLGDGDLYISFRTQDETWSDLRNMGTGINSGKREFCPMLSPDGKYLLFTSKRAGEGDIFWVDAGIIEKLRNADQALPLADRVLVDKSERKMWLLHAGNRYREYEISLGDNPTGHKQQEGDERTPEGRYTIDFRNPDSSYHLSLHITYPNAQDSAHAQSLGVSPGGDIFIHGLPNGMGALAFGFKHRDWTDGCIAVNNEEIEEIWSLVKNGTPIEILP